MGSEASFLSLFTVYAYPLDYPDSYVVREYRVGRERMEACPAALFPTLEACREELRSRGLTRLDRNHDDDEKVVETWL